jgi:DNA-binding CsgD family transcriptional regulator/tetratricopeptide (TPR) repeat protein
MTSPVMVGRDAELSRLRAALEAAGREGAASALLVAGEAGVGKTRLIDEFTERAGHDGALVLAGACLDVGETAAPFAPVAEAFRSLPAVLGPTELSEVLGGSAQQLARVVPALGHRQGHLPKPDGALFEHVLGVLERLGGRGPVVLVAEDVHWAGRSTIELLAFLIGNLRGPVLILLTWRDDEPGGPGPALGSFLAELDRGHRTERVRLARLAGPQVAELVATITGAEPSRHLMETVWSRSDGNPFFAEEVLAASADGLALPAELRDLALARMRALPAAAWHVLRAAAVAGRRVEHRLLAEVTGSAEPKLLAAVRQAVEHHVLTVDGEAYVFRHALGQEAVYADMLPAERSVWHGKYAAALAGRAAQVQEASAAELGQLAHHWHAAGNRREALLASIDAGRAAQRATAYPEAYAHDERALALWDLAPPAATPVDLTGLLQHAAQMASLAGYAEQAVSLARRAITSAGPAVNPLAAGSLRARLATYLWEAGDTPGALAELRQAADAMPDDPPSTEAAAIEALQGRLLMLRGRNREAATRGSRALTLARAVRAGDAEASALCTLAAAAAARGQVDEAIDQLHRAARVAAGQSDITGLLRIQQNLAATLWTSGRCAASADVAVAAAQIAREAGLRTETGMLLANAGAALVRIGRWAEADRFLQMSGDAVSPTTLGSTYHLLQRSLLRLWQGDITQARADLARVLTNFPDLDPQLACPVYTQLAEVALWSDRPGEAREAAAAGLRAVEGNDDPAYVLPLCRAGLAAVATDAQRARIHRDNAGIDQSRRASDQLITTARAIAAPADTTLTPVTEAELLTAEAEYNRTIGRDEASRWDEAAVAWAGLRYPFPRAYTRWRQAELELTAGTRASASAALAEAWHLAGSLPAQQLQHEIEALAARARITLPSSQRPAADKPEPGTGLGLTARELEVLKLLAAGRTNRQIGAQLFISPRTVGVHVSHILAKLGLASRGEAAAAAHALGLTSPAAPPGADTELS